MSHATKAGMIVDCAPYYKAIYECIEKARHNITIVGWDIDSRIALLQGKDRPDPRLSYRLADVVSRKARENPDIHIYMLKWHPSFIYAKERERLARLKWLIKTPPNVHMCIDSLIPFGSSHHQKIIIIDDQVAFNGGMDIAVGRWDTRAHWYRDPQRRGPVKPHGPYHDVQMVMEGDIVKELAELARWRWARVAGFPMIAQPDYEGGVQRPDVWPDSIPPTLFDVPVRKSLSFPAMDDSPLRNEIGPLYSELIQKARHFIYIENQYLTYLPIAEALNAQLRRHPALRVVILSPYDPQGIVEKITMWQGRILFREALMKDIEPARVLMAYAITKKIKDGLIRNIHKTIRIHAKLMIIDNDILHVGSANLNARSIGMDSECDLTFTAQTDEHRRAIHDMRQDLIEEHTGHSYAYGEFPTPAALLAPQPDYHRAVRVIDDSIFMSRRWGPLFFRIADKTHPYLPAIFDPAFYRNEAATAWKFGLYKVIFAMVLLAMMIGLWHVFALDDATTLEDKLALMKAQPGFSLKNLLAVVVGYIFLTSLTFPLTVLILFTASVFGTTLGFVYSFAGALLACAVSFLLGRLLGEHSLRRWMGIRLHKIDDRLHEARTLHVAAIRLVPAAPFGLVNLVAGISSVRFLPFIAGSALGMIPGLLVLSLLGSRFDRLLNQMSLGNFVSLALALGLCGLFMWFGHSIIQRYYTRDGADAEINHHS